jgi:hypothetical protein
MRRGAEDHARDAVAVVENLSGRTATAFMSNNHIEPDFAVETFRLAPLPIVAKQLPLEADAVGADTRWESQPDIAGRQPARQHLELEQRLSGARRRDPLPPLALYAPSIS